MSWANLCALVVGAAVAVVGGLLNVPGLLALGSSIVGGVLGNAIPGRQGHGAQTALLVADRPTPRDPRPRARRRRGTPASGPPDFSLVEGTLRNRMPGGGPPGE